MICELGMDPSVSVSALSPEEKIKKMKFSSAPLLNLKNTKWELLIVFLSFSDNVKR